MIHKLRQKFILINMTLISLVLLSVFGTLCFSNYQRLRKDSQNAMERALNEPSNLNLTPKLDFKKRPEEKTLHMIPVFAAEIKADGTVSSIGKGSVTLSYEDLKTAVKEAVSSGKTTGTLDELGLRYLMENAPEGQRIAFADISYEQQSQRITVRNSLLIFIGAFTAFFIINLFLSKWALNPVSIAWNRQRQFIADASHELKTPLTVILANMNILLSHRQDTIQHQVKWIENTQTEADRMKKLVDSLLFLAKSDTERISPVRSDFDLSDAVWSCILPFESIAFEQMITMTEEIASGIHFVGDESQIKQLVVILLDNACKYAGKKGTVTVCLKQEQGKIHFHVNNTGEPIPAEDIQHIFERFYRTDKSRSRTEGGYGLGLAIAKNITEKHNGKISAFSNTENGTTIQVLFGLP